MPDELRDKPCLHVYLQILQGSINRLGNNSLNCKTWCMTIVIACVALALDKGKMGALLLAPGPVILFAFLDAYYLSLEKDFRNLYQNTIEKLNSGDLQETDIFVIQLNGKPFIRAGNVLCGLKSFAVWPYYGTLLAIIVWGA